MNHYFFDELKQLRREARRYLGDRCPTAASGRIMQVPEPYDRALSRAIGEMGWVGATILEALGHAALNDSGARIA